MDTTTANCQEKKTATTTATAMKCHSISSLTKIIFKDLNYMDFNLENFLLQEFAQGLPIDLNSDI